MGLCLQEVGLAFEPGLEALGVSMSKIHHGLSLEPQKRHQQHGTSSSLRNGLVGLPAAALCFASSPKFAFYQERTSHVLPLTHTGVTKRRLTSTEDCEEWVGSQYFVLWCTPLCTDWDLLLVYRPVTCSRNSLYYNKGFSGLHFGEENVSDMPFYLACPSWQPSCGWSRTHSPA